MGEELSSRRVDFPCKPPLLVQSGGRVRGRIKSASVSVPWGTAMGTYSVRFNSGPMTEEIRAALHLRLGHDGLFNPAASFQPLIRISSLSRLGIRMKLVSGSARPWSRSRPRSRLSAPIRLSCCFSSEAQLLSRLPPLAVRKGDDRP